MNFRTVSWLTAVVLIAVAAAQGVALAAAVAYGEPWRPFASSIVTGVGLAVLLYLPARRTELALDHRSAFLAVTAAWLSACVVGGVPFFYHPAMHVSPLDALFESASGFTTTGATLLSGLDRMPRSILLWRALSHWLGGMGIVLLGIAVFPVLGLGGMQLYKAEAPGPTKDKITPRIAETAKLLWVLYLGVTAADALLLYLGGMTPFDAICHAMATISTGGFSTHDASLGYYDSGFVHLVTTVFMLVGGMSFAVLHRALTRGIHLRESPELRVYLVIFAIAAALITIDLRTRLPDQFPDAAAALQHAVFQAASILTTTGFTSQDYALWPPLSHAILLALFFCGGMAGSTGGGIKVIRLILIARLAFSQFFRLVHPRAYGAVKLGARTVEDQVVLSVLGFFGMWILLLLVGTGLLCAFGSDLLTGFTASAVTLGNIGPGFGGVGPSHTYESFSAGAKLSMIALMILGRLEIYAVLVIFTPRFWER